MKTKIYIATFLLFLTPVWSFAHDYAQPSSWETTSHGVSLGMELGMRDDGQESETVLFVYVKNVSSKPKYRKFIGYDNDIKVCYVDDDGKAVPLHNRPMQNSSSSSFNIAPPEIAPGSTWRTVVDVSDADTKMLLTHLVFFECDVPNDPSQSQIIRSTPVKLTLPPAAK